MTKYEQIIDDIKAMIQAGDLVQGEVGADLGCGVQQLGQVFLEQLLDAALVMERNEPWPLTAPAPTGG